MWLRFLATLFLATLCVLLATWGPASSQSNVIGGGITGDVKRAAYTGPGDIVSGAAAWYGLRAYTAAIAAAATQTLVNLRNTATSETCDVVVATNGGFGNVANCSASSNGDTVAVFCAESSGSCTVAEIYDQSGNGINPVQATAANQPALTLNCLGSLPCMTGTGTQYLVSAGNVTGHAQPTSMEIVASASNVNSYALTIDNSRPFIAHYTSANTWDLNCGSDTSFTASDNVPHVFSLLCSGASSIANVDGNETTISAGATAMATGVVDYMVIAATFGPLQGKMFEGGFWPSGFSSANRTSMCHNGYSYWGTATSC